MRVALGATAALFVVSGYFDFLKSPDDAWLGPSQRIFYVHMGAAFVVALAFTVACAASTLYLATRQLRFDRWACASAEVGMVFTSMLLTTGILWGKVVWGVWWTWDPRLTATLILWVLFWGYLLLRDGIRFREQRARVSAVLALVCYLDVPLDYMTIRWWKSIHPIVITAQGINMAPTMIGAMCLTSAAMVALYLSWVTVRVRLMGTEDILDDVKNGLRDGVRCQFWGDGS